MSENNPTGPGQVSPDGNYVWDGNAWQPRNQALAQPGPAYGYQQQPPKKSRTWLWVLLIIGVIMVLGCGGCFAVVGGPLNSADKAIQKHDNQKGGHDNPITITAGKGFTIGDNEYHSGWRMKND